MKCRPDEAKDDKSKLWGRRGRPKGRCCAQENTVSIVRFLICFCGLGGCQVGFIYVMGNVDCSTSTSGFSPTVAISNTFGRSGSADYRLQRCRVAGSRVAGCRVAGCKVAGLACAAQGKWSRLQAPSVQATSCKQRGHTRAERGKSGRQEKFTRKHSVVTLACLEHLFAFRVFKSLKQCR